MPGGGGEGGGVIQPYPKIEPAYYAVLYGDVLFLWGIDANGLCASASGKVAYLIAVQVNCNVVCIDVDGGNVAAGRSTKTRG
jgi:hypothetical protein